MHVYVRLLLPEVVLSAECPAVSQEAAVPVLQSAVALGAAQAGRVPLQIGGDVQDEGVPNLQPAARTHRPCATETGLLHTQPSFSD